MEEFNDFFDLSKNPTKRVELKGPQTGGAMAISQDELEELFSKGRQPYASSSKGTDYAERYKQLDLEKSLQQLDLPEEDKSKEMLDDLTSLGDVNRVNDLVEDTLYYKRYSIQSKSRLQLPINDMKEKILSTIDQSPVTIIEGPTGCGKTTQIPHWILKDCYDKRQYCNIVVTQPRRIAAISVAKRVCEENNYEMSSIVGYRVGLDSKISKDTRLQYVTTGVLLQKLVGSRNMDNLTHVILDEVHERDQDMDFLFIVIKKLRTANIKIVLMSATFDLDIFANYFRFSSYNGLQTPPIIKVDSPRMYEIKIFYLNTLSILGKLPEVEYSDPGISKDMNIFTLKILNAFEFIDSNEEKNPDGTNTNYMPSVLIFLPGIFEIEELYKILTNQKLRNEVSPEWSHCKWWIVPLHSTITSEEQQQVFKPTPPGYRKIILATNIAESSITVPDIKYVIDFCLTKVLMSNPETNFSTLRMTWASQANLKQRAGRAGRVREGRVYRMVLQDFYNRLDDNCVPEMQRCPLDNLVLKSKVLNMGPPVSILALAMDPPDLSNITRTILSLKQVGALLKTVSGEMSLDDGDITYLGRIMSKLPLDVRFSKLIMLGHIFGVLDDCIIMACGMSVKNVFSTPFQIRMGAFLSKLAWADGSTSDCLALLNVYKVYTHLRNINFFSSHQGGEKAWAKTSFLQIHALRELVSLVTELKQRLAKESIVHCETYDKLWNDIDRPFILKLLLSGAFYPYYFTLTRWGEDKEREATRTLCGRDPRNTVYYTGMDYNQPGIIYSERIKKLLEHCPSEDMTVSFDSNSSKVFVTFANRESLSANINNNLRSQIPGQVILPVYTAIKCRQIKIPTSIAVMTVEKSMEYAINLGLYKSKGQKEWEKVADGNSIQELMQPRIPDIDENFIHIIISHVIDCSHFWCIYADQTTQDQLDWLCHCLQQPLPPLTSTPKVGQICVAPYSASEGAPFFYYRARIDKVNKDNLVWVFLIDRGNSCLIPLNTLKALGPQCDVLTKIKALAFQCVLSETAPSIVKDQKARWTEAAQKRFAKLTLNKRLLGKVYSVAMGVVSLELFSDNVSVNKTLVNEGHAQEVEESYISRLNRDIRDTAENLQPIQKNALNKQQRKEYSSTLAVSIKPPDIKDCKREITLKGPFSPLETHLLHLMYAGKDKVAHIEWNSVNSILLTTDPQDLNDRLLVAASIDQSSNGGNLTLRHTTMLPNIRGLPSLVALMFSPVVELKPDSTLCHYGAILCGLGHVDGSPLFPEQDILVPIDFELDRVDLQNINKLRYHMDLVLFTESGQESPMNQLNVGATTKEIKTLFKTLMTRKRRWREPPSVSRPWQWAANYNVDEAEATNFIGERAIFPPHNALELRRVSPQELMKMTLENQRVHKACNGILLSGPSNQKVECTLCHTDELTLTAMRLHLSSRLHKERESELPRLDEVEDN